jgi:conjugal transfer ATP-binding protein TraC
MAITQSINDFYASSEAKAAYNNSDNKIIMRQDPKSFQTFVQENPSHFTPYEAQLITHFKPSSISGYSEFLFQQSSNSTFHRLMLDPVSKILYSSKAQEYQFVKNKMDEGIPVHQAIIEAAHVFFGDEMQIIQSFVLDKNTQ